MALRLSQRNEIDKIVEETTGAHIISVLPAVQEHGFALSPFEVFIVKKDRIANRFSLGDCELLGYHNKNERTRQVELFMHKNGSYSTSGYKSDIWRISVNGTDDLSQFKRHYRIVKNFFFGDWQYFWEKIILEGLDSIETERQMWESISAMNRIERQHSLNLKLEQSLRKSLFTNLDAFLIPTGSSTINVSEFAKTGDIYEGVTPSLAAFVKWLQNIPQLSGSEGNYFDIFSDEQKRALQAIEKDLTKFDPYSFWQTIEQISEIENIDSIDKLNFVLREADIQRTSSDKKEELIATYIRTARNILAHNLEATSIEEMYLLRIGYTPVAGDLVISQALEICFDFVQRLNDNVFCLLPERLKSWEDCVKRAAASDTRDLETRLQSHSDSSL